MKLLLSLLIPFNSLFVCETFVTTNWTQCPVAHENFKPLQARYALSAAHCLTQCSYTPNCKAVQWQRTWTNCNLGSYETSKQNVFSWIMAHEVFYVKNETAHCHITNMGVRITNKANTTDCNARGLANASSIFPSPAAKPCAALSDVSNSPYKSNQNATITPEWWYNMRKLCYVEKIKIKQQSGTNETVMAYVLPNLASPRHAKTFCDKRSAAKNTDFWLICNGLRGGRFLLLKKDIPGFFAISKVEIYGLCL